MPGKKRPDHHHKEPSMTAYFTLAQAACRAVAALLPGATTQDDGAGEYVRLDDAGLAWPATLNGVLLYVLNPADATDPKDAWHWQYQHVDAEPMILETSELTLTDAAEDVAAWARTLMARPNPNPEPADVATFQPLVTVTRRPDGTGWTMYVDWSDSFHEFEDANGTVLDSDSHRALAACAAVDAWTKQQPPTYIVPAVATYHGLVKAECRQCDYTTTDVGTLELWNDLGGTCPNCDFDDGENAWTSIDGTVTVCRFIDGEMIGKPETVTP